MKFALATAVLVAATTAAPALAAPGSPPPSFVIPAGAHITEAQGVDGDIAPPKIGRETYMDDVDGGGGAACGWAPLAEHWMNGFWGLTGGWGWDGEASWCWNGGGGITAFSLSAWPWFDGNDRIDQFGVYGNVVNVCAHFSLPWIGDIGGGCNTSRVYAYPGFVVTVT